MIDQIPGSTVSCEKCKVENCSSCTSEKTIGSYCNTCQEGLFNVNHIKCHSCPQENCSTCDQLECKGCIDGYFLDTNILHAQDTR